MQASKIYAGFTDICRTAQAYARLMQGLCKAGPGLCRPAQAFAGLEDIQAGWAA